MLYMRERLVVLETIILNVIIIIIFAPIYFFYSPEHFANEYNPTAKNITMYDSLFYSTAIQIIGFTDVKAVTTFGHAIIIVQQITVSIFFAYFIYYYYKKYS